MKESRHRPFDVGFLMDAIMERALVFFRDDLYIDAHIGHHDRVEEVQKIELRFLTSLLVLEGRSKLYVAFSFQRPLIEQAFRVYSEDIEVAEGEREGYMEETAGDMINIIVGNATARLPSDDTTITISPPIVITEAKSIFRHKDARFHAASLDTDYGKMDVYCISPKETFGELLLSNPSQNENNRRIP